MSNTIHHVVDFTTILTSRLMQLFRRNFEHLRGWPAAELFEDIALKYAPKIQRPSFKLILALTTDPHDTEEFQDKDIV
jgi:hypothetical protein